ncbi:MAG: DUF4433 domain-containing protein [Comamonadaceae bacterium]|jgi:hypothetical protein|uniref:DarT ssDNA thymidine ADP-ribosyltransferase family protein n=1 Tax=Candidatus Skiveiella danica TaxID=3386177 RepID=UPI003909DF74|nr:DUF4433 domain-containing protein [Comamonadaceae bacterium]
MKLKNDWWGYTETYGWVVMLDIQEDNHGGRAIFYSFKKDEEFDTSFRNLDSNGITFALRHLKSLPTGDQINAKAEMVRLQKEWPSIQASRLAERARKVEHEKQERENLKRMQEQEALKFENERKLRYQESLQREQLRRQNIRQLHGFEAINYLTENGIKYLWHFTSPHNLTQIAATGYLYGHSTNPDPSKVKYLSDDLSRELDHRFQRDHFVRLSFIPNSWYFHRVRKMHHLIWLRFSLDFLKTEEVYFSKGNAASSNVPISSELAELDIDWKIMNSFQGLHTDDKGPVNYPSSFLKEDDDPVAFRETKETWNSEVLVANHLSLSYCNGMYDARSGVKIPL